MLLKSREWNIPGRKNNVVGHISMLKSSLFYVYRKECLDRSACRAGVSGGTQILSFLLALPVLVLMFLFLMPVDFCLILS